MRISIFVTSFAAFILASCATRSAPTTVHGPEIPSDDKIAASSVFVWRVDGDDRAGFCNGVLVADGHVATAARCVAEKDTTYRVGSAVAETVVDVDSVLRSKDSDVALLKLKSNMLPLKPAAVALDTTAISGALHIPTYAQGSNGKAVRLSKLSGEQDVQESMPGVLAMRVHSARATGLEGSGVFMEQDGKPILVGILSRDSWRGQTCYTQDLRGLPLLTKLSH